MIAQNLENINVTSFASMPTPEELHAKLPLTDKASDTVTKGRADLRAILERKDKRLFVVVGPCSIHDPVAGLDYARRLKALQEEVKDTMLLVMRVYFEKPRTTTGWKGYINDPYMDDSFRVDEGMVKARQFLLDVCELGLPTATEALDPISPQYLGDLIAWTAIGARTTESQTHREMSSGLSTPVGFKNGTDGDIGIAINAILSAANPHAFLGINSQGSVSVVRTRGNPHGRAARGRRPA
jgi:3-deoxy-7-phosphoheptulonate synthase